MIKKRAIILVLAAELLIYLFLLVAWPMLTEAIYSTGVDNHTSITGNINNHNRLEIDNLIDEGWILSPEIHVVAISVSRDWLPLALPGLFGAGAILLILRQKKEANSGNM